MNQYFYECAQDSELGKKISDFWTKCNRCNFASHDYAKKMGAVSFEPDYDYFEGGVTGLYFPDDAKVDLGVWRVSMINPKTNENLYVPNVNSRIGYAEIPHREYALRDTFDRIYHRDRIIQNDGKLYVPYTEFYRDEPAGTRHDIKGGKQPRTASKGLRKAIKAEVRRRRLPVMPVTVLLNTLAATVPAAPSSAVSGSPADTPTVPAASPAVQTVPAASPAGNPTMTDRSRSATPPILAMPTFFPFRSRYFISCPYPCQSPDLTPITAQEHRMNADKWQREAKTPS